MVIKIFASLCFGRKQPQHWKGYYPNIKGILAETGISVPCARPIYKRSKHKTREIHKNYVNSAFLAILNHFISNMLETSSGRAKSRTHQSRLLVPKKLTSPSVLTKQWGVVPGIVDKWHHLVLLPLEILYRTQTESSIPLMR